MRRTVKQKVERYESKLDRDAKRQATDKARSSAAGLGQELNPGKRGNIEEAAEAADKLTKRPMYVKDNGDDELMKFHEESKVDIAEVFSEE